MNIGPRQIFLALALLLFGVSALWTPENSRVSLVPAGLFFLTLAFLFP